MIKLTAGLQQYLITMLWAEHDGDNPLDANYSVNDISREALERATMDWDLFQSKAGGLLDGLDITDVAHDFWLTRNGHGAGFWDGDYPEALGEALTALSDEFGPCNPYVGDDGLIYFE